MDDDDDEQYPIEEPTAGPRKYIPLSEIDMLRKRQKGE